jgi:hypothetical protein
MPIAKKTIQLFFLIENILKLFLPVDKILSHFSIKNIFNAVSLKGSLLWLICLGKTIPVISLWVTSTCYVAMFFSTVSLKCTGLLLLYA